MSILIPTSFASAAVERAAVPIRLRAIFWTAAFSLMAIEVPNLGYTKAVGGAEIIITALFTAGAMRKRRAVSSLDLPIGGWLLAQLCATIRAYMTGWGSHSPYVYDLYAGGPMGPVRLLIDWACAFAAYFGSLWETEDGGDLLRRISPILFAAGAVVMICTIEQYRNMTTPIDDPRLQATFTNPNLLGSFLCLALPLAFAAALERGMKLSARTASGALTLLVGAALILTESRGAILGGLIGCGFMACVAWRRSASDESVRRRRGRSAAKTLAVGCLLAVALGLAVFPRVLHQSRSISDDQRRAAWTAAVLIIRSQPLLGIGANGFPAAMSALNLRERNAFTPTGLTLEHAVHLHAHDLFLQSWVERGLFGFLLAAGLIVAVGRRAYKLLAEDGPLLVCGAAAGALALLAQNIADYTLWFAPVNIALWYLLSIAFKNRQSR